MKYPIKKSFLIVMLVTLLILFSGCFYSRVAMVTDVTGDLVTVACANGNVFSFRGDDYLQGDLCSLILFDSFTSSVHDDNVVSARYGGYIELFENLI